MDKHTQDEARRLDHDILRALASMNRGPLDGGVKAESETPDLVDLAVRIHAEFAPPEPSTDFVSTGRVRLENRLRGRTTPDRRTAARVAPRRWSFARRLAFAVLSLVLALSVGSAGIAYASQDSLPGDGLYGLKVGIENTRLALTRAPDDRLQLLTEFAANRIAEASALVNSNRPADLGRALDEYQAELSQAQTLAADLPEANRNAVLAEVQLRLQQHIDLLQAVRDRAPAAAQPALDQAIQSSSHGQNVIQQIEQGDSPSEVAPGQLKKVTPDANDNNPHGPPATPPGKSKH